ncbi:hypothetical protein MFUR16E_16180 [Methylobacterium fujisawaense]|uniref:hypothetical protein n=1 Tax=Methylobacterium fujisawaense TaxID=107400 RepID=UPI002F2FDA9E
MPTIKILAATAVKTALLSGPSATSEGGNQQVVLAFYDLAFAKHRPNEAAEIFIGDRISSTIPACRTGRPLFGDF